MQVTIDGPGGVSKFSDRIRPPATEIPPITDAQTAICSGVSLNARAVDAGIIKSVATNKMPTTLIAVVTVSAIHRIRSILIYLLIVLDPTNGAYTSGFNRL